MKSLFGKPLPRLTLLLTLLTVGCAQQVVAPPPPPPPTPPAVISKVTSAKKIFLSNAGADSTFTHFIPLGPDVTYNELYASLKQWGYFQLVDSPSQADLIFEIRSSTIIHDYIIKPGGNVNIASDTTEAYIRPSHCPSPTLRRMIRFIRSPCLPASGATRQRPRLPSRNPSAY